MNKVNEFKNGTIDEAGNVSFSGDLYTPIGKMPYTITGTFIDGVIQVSYKLLDFL